MARYASDPRWITARYESVCAGKDCTRAIRKGDQVYYYPLGRKVFSGQCAEAASAGFEACRFDEDGF